MKSLVLLFMACAVIDFSEAMTRDEMIDGFKKLSIECAVAEGATDNDMVEIYSRKTPSSRAGKCVHACLGERIGVMKNNQVDVENTVAVADIAYNGDAEKIKLVRELANDCAGITDADRCEAAVKIFECGHNAVKTRGITFEDV